MARGRHAASAAKRRAESAEDQLDRLLPKLVEAERTAKRYRSEAERATALSAELSRLRDEVGIPVAVHQQELDEQAQAHADQTAALLKAVDVVFSTLVRFARVPHDGNWIAPRFLEALRSLPDDRGRTVLSGLGLSRDECRGFLDPGLIAQAVASNMGDARLAEQLSRAEGNPAGVPSAFLEGAANPLAPIEEPVAS